jgi:pyruvate dehydrogenase E2 component (dihydrolipoamide acetyltransferase)
MATPIRMPQPGQMTEECTVLTWFKKEGDRIARGDALFEIETDKSNMEIEAFDEGTLLRILAPEGATVPVDTIVAWIGEAGEAIPEVAAAPAVVSPAVAPPVAPPAAPPSAPAPVAAVPPGLPTPPVAASAPGGGADAATGRLAISPRASRLAAELGIDPRSVTGTGPGGRIVERDVQAAASAPPAPASVPAAAPAPLEAPIARPAVAPAPVAAPVPWVPADAGEGQPLSRLRQVIARRLTQSVQTIPHFSVTVAVDMTGLVGLRAELRATGSPITITDFVHEATAQTLVEFPLVNSLTDGTTFWMRERVHLGVAVSVPGGLLVPVIRDAQALGLADLHDRTVALVEGARAGKLGPDELSGSTFSVSNMGMFGVEQFTAIINPGESAILAVSSVQPTAVAVGDGLAVRHVMRLTLSADHRLVDGELGARFLNALRRRLQDTEAYRAAAATG